MKIKKEKMKKGKKTVCIVMAIVCFALAIVMSMQFKIVKEADATSIDSMREDELRTELANWKKMYNQAQDQYNEKLAKLEEYRNNEKTSEESSKLVETELAQANLYLGKTDVEGQGITIKIEDIDESKYNQSSDNDEENLKPLSADQLLVLVDNLKLAGAEAISVNDQRIISTSDIVSINSNSGSGAIICVNQQRISAPYTIKAIGDSSKLESTLTGNDGYVEQLKNYGFNIDISKGKISISKYDGDITSKYIQ